MEKFAVDLDKVLDEFEEREGLLGDTSPAAFPVPKDSIAAPIIGRVANFPKAFGTLPNQNGDHSPSVQLTANGNHVLDHPKVPSFYSDYPTLTAEIAQPVVGQPSAKVLDCERYRPSIRPADAALHELVTSEKNVSGDNEGYSPTGKALNDAQESASVIQPYRVLPLGQFQRNEVETHAPATDMPPLQAASSLVEEGSVQSQLEVSRHCPTEKEDCTKDKITLDSNRNMLEVCEADATLQKMPLLEKKNLSQESSKSGADLSDVSFQLKEEVGGQEDSLRVDEELHKDGATEDQTDKRSPGESSEEAVVDYVPSGSSTCEASAAVSDDVALSALLDDPIVIPEECSSSPVLSSVTQSRDNDGAEMLMSELESCSESVIAPSPPEHLVQKDGEPVPSGSPKAPLDFVEDEVLRVSVANGVEIQLIPAGGIDLEDVPSEPTNSSLCSLTGEATIITEEELPMEGAGLSFEQAAEATDRELEALLTEEEERGSISSPQDEEEERSFFPPLSEEEQLLGKVKPFWIPDVDAPACMLCDTRFTVLKRRHHCRACGKVLCGNCCRYKSKLPCLENKEGRVCQPCLTVLNRVAAVERLSSPNPNNPEEYCSRGPPALQNSPTNGESPPLTVLVPVLRKGPRPGGDPPKQVVFSDGIRPGGDLSEIAEGLPVMPASRPRGVKEVMLPGGGQEEVATSPTRGRPAKKVVVSDAEGTLPPILLKGTQLNENLDATKLMSVLKDENADPVIFALTKNLRILAKIVKLDCCMNCYCWCFSSCGLSSLGQDEVLLLFDYTEVESTVPRDALRLFSTLHDNAVHGGAPVGPMAHLLFPDGVLGSRDQSGFLFVPPTLQCVKKLPLPRAPWLAAILVHRWEVPWAKLLPLRLVLRLGSEYRYYPCPLMSTRFRKPVYGEVGHTIMNVLLDFRNFQYGLPSLGGLVVHVEGQRTTVHVPRNRYEALCRVLDSNEHVLALGANLSLKADSHLVCVQGDEGTYRTQAVHVAHEEQKVTGATFIVFSGALKGAGDAKCSVVEDGLLVQLSPTAMAALRTALRAMKDWDALSGPEESVAVVWEEDDRQCNIGVISPIDNQRREGVPSVRVRNATDYSSQKHVIRWTEVFFLHMDDARKTSEESQRVSEALAKSFCMAMLPHLSQLHRLGIVGLRVELGPEQVGYEAGANGKPLPSSCLGELDCALVPLLTTAQERLAVELVFHILAK